MAITWDDSDPRVRFWEEAPGRYHLDVRPLLEGGGRPFGHIMACARQVSADDRLYLHAPFEPKPLFAQLQRMGLHHEARREGPDHWVVEIRQP